MVSIGEEREIVQRPIKTLMTEATTAWYPIGAVAKKTGLSVHTLRAWERRYAVVEPQRSAGGTRLYSTADVTRLRLLRRATQLGHSISQVADRDIETLRDLVREEIATPVDILPKESRENEAGWIVEEVLKSVELMDGSRVHALLMRAVVQLSVAEVVDDVLGPVLQKAGDLWAAGTICPANEHLLSVNVRRVLSWLLESVPVAERSPTLVVTTPAGHWHDIGAHIAGIFAAIGGWRVVFLGPNLPATDILRSVEILDARAVMLGVTMTESDRLVDELEELRENVPPDVAILVGGRGAEPYREHLNRLSIEFIPAWKSVQASLVPHYAEVAGSAA